MWGPCTEPVSADGPQMRMLRPRWIPRSSQLLEMVLAADDGDNSAEYRSELEPGPDWHLLERPLHVLIALPARPQLGALRVDVLDYCEGGRDLSLRCRRIWRCGRASG